MFVLGVSTIDEKFSEESFTAGLRGILCRSVLRAYTGGLKHNHSVSRTCLHYYTTSLIAMGDDAPSSHMSTLICCCPDMFQGVKKQGMFSVLAVCARSISHTICFDTTRTPPAWSLHLVCISTPLPISHTCGERHIHPLGVIVWDIRHSHVTHPLES